MITCLRTYGLFRIHFCRKVNWSNRLIDFDPRWEGPYHFWDGGERVPPTLRGGERVPPTLWWEGSSHFETAVRGSLTLCGGRIPPTLRMQWEGPSHFEAAVRGSLPLRGIQISHFGNQIYSVYNLYLLEWLFEASFLLCWIDNNANYCSLSYSDLCVVQFLSHELSRFFVIMCNFGVEDEEFRSLRKRNLLIVMLLRRLTGRFLSCHDHLTFQVCCEQLRTTMWSLWRVP